MITRAALRLLPRHEIELQGVQLRYRDRLPTQRYPIVGGKKDGGFGYSGDVSEIEAQREIGSWWKWAKCETVGTAGPRNH